jgi:NitT/TauT family transport system permease protein
MKIVSGQRIKILGLQVLILGVGLAAWQYLPEVPWLAHHSYHVLDRNFVSSPQQVWEQITQLVAPASGQLSVWQYLWHSVSAALIGLVVGIGAGGLLGLVLSASRFLSDLLQPFVVAANAVPRIALIPVVILVVGPTFRSSIVICISVVFFIAFFNAYEGGRTVTASLLQNAQILGASRLQVTWVVRSRYAVAWTIAGLPISATYAVIAVVTGELLTGYPGLGKLILDAQATTNAPLTFAVVVILSIVGLVMIGIANLLKARLLHWWGR